MLKNPRKKTSFSRIRALNRPELIQVREGDDHDPAMIISHGQKAKIISVDDVWEIVDEWWRAIPIARRYYRVVVERGAIVTIFHDLINGIWYEQRV